MRRSVCAHRGGGYGFGLLWSLVAIFLAAGLPAAGQTEILSNPGFETPTAPGNGSIDWHHNPWGSPWPTVTYSREGTNPHEGSWAQIIDLSGLSGTAGYIYYQPFSATGGRVYEASVWVRSTNNAKVTFALREQGSPYRLYGAETVTVGSTWQKVTLRGGAPSDGTVWFAFIFRSPGKLWLDAASLKDVTGSVFASAPADTATAIPARFFGMHMNHWQSYSPWPEEHVKFGLTRLWDTGTRWKDIEPSDDNWTWSRLDKFITDATATDPNAQFIYTLGQTPQWASLRPSEDSHNGPGAAAPPADVETGLGEWREYVRAVAIRNRDVYGGRIKYWEIWNEADQRWNSQLERMAFWSGTIEQMVLMGQAAYEELKDIDPDCVVIAPNGTFAHGLEWLDKYFAAGGVPYTDAVSYHQYLGLKPEVNIPTIEAWRSMVSHWGLGDKPLLIDEGRIAKGGGVAPTDAESRAAVARWYIAQWVHGSKNYSWYCWDHTDKPQYVKLALSGHAAPSPAGLAYRNLGDWLKGARITHRAVDGNETWTVTLVRPGGYVGRIIWCAKNWTYTYTIPSGWGITRKRDLSGGLADMTGLGGVTISGEPILLENRVAPVEAEHTEIGGGVIVENSATGFTGEGYLNMPVTSGYAQWERLQMAQSGSCTLRIHFAHGSSNNRTVKVIVNGGSPSYVTFTPTGSWSNWSSIDAPVTLQAGTNTVRIETLGHDAGNIDRLEILPAP